MGLHTRQMITVVFAVVIVASACSDSTTAEDGTEATAATAPVAANPPADHIAFLDDELESVVDALISAHGEKAAFEAIVAALERGYDYGQVRDGAVTETLGADGRIVVADGELVPADGRAGILTLPDDPGEDEGALEVGASPVSKRRQPKDDEYNLQQLRNALAPINVQLRDLADDPIGPDQVSPGKALAVAILALGRSGYTLDQIIEAIVFNDARIERARGGCTVLAGGAVARPAGSFKSDCSQRAKSLWQSLDDDYQYGGTAPTVEEAAVEPTAEAIPDSISFAGGAIGQPARNTLQGELEAGEVVFSATVADGMVQMTVWTSYWGWLRGGPTDPPHEDQNCGARLTEQLTGSGEAGTETSFDLLVVSSEQIDFQGALCQDRDGDFRIGDPNQRRFTFSGKADHTGIDGVLSGIELRIQSAS